MEYLHIRSLEKYHPGYKDRTLQWGKIHFKMVQGDPDCDLIENEIDWGRLIKMILLELEAQKPLPNIDSYWAKKGFDVKKRPMSLTLKMLHNFIEVIQDLTLDRHVDKDKEKDKDKIKSKSREIPPTLEEVSLYCKERHNNINPESFINYYTSKGWMIGKNKMVDWRATIRTWESKDRDNLKPKPTQAQINTMNSMNRLNERIKNEEGSI